MRQCFIGNPNTLIFVKNTAQKTVLSIIFSTLFSVFGYPDETLSLVFDILHKDGNQYVTVYAGHVELLCLSLNMKYVNSDNALWISF